jgi:hypothetical protein
MARRRDEGAAGVLYMGGRSRRHRCPRFPSM